ncbi:MAG: hypothetical protein HFE78_06655 [Clostridiales bacterium]|nr:hypothetical protein [Clostridiales bacterium]
MKETEERQLYDNLKDAGFHEEAIRQFFTLRKNGRKQEQLRLLSLQRASLLDQIHSHAKQIDCLDYLVYTMNHDQKNQ